MEQSFESAVEKIVQQHPEYAAEAYRFVRDSLDAAVERLGKTQADPHLSAEELYMGVCAHALDEFGPLAPEVLGFWGVRRSADVGSIVYNLIEAGVFGRSKDDTREQFNNLPPMQDILDAPYLPG